jgi:hypothetical protein
MDPTEDNTNRAASDHPASARRRGADGSSPVGSVSESPAKEGSGFLTRRRSGLVLPGFLVEGPETYAVGHLATHGQYEPTHSQGAPGSANREAHVQGYRGIGFSDPRSHSSRPWLFCSLALPMGAVSLVSGILSSLEILVPPWRSGGCRVATRTPPHVCALFFVRSRPRRCPCDWR